MNTADIPDSFLTVAEVAELLKLNQQTVRNWIDQGSLPAFKVGRRVRILRSDLERVLAEGYSAGGGSARPAGGNSVRQAPAGPSAEDFWGGEAVGTAEPPPVTHDPLGVAAPDPGRADGGSGPPSDGEREHDADGVHGPGRSGPAIRHDDDRR